MTKEKKFYNLSFDLLFKKVFGQSWALAVLLTLIWSYMDKKVQIKPQDITYLDPRIQKHHTKKETIKDIFVKVKVNGAYKNVYVDLEM